MDGEGLADCVSTADSQCKECGGASICEHGRVRSKCKECTGTKRRKQDSV